ncbi:hypothetical protein [Helicobacter bilis]|uniref:Uncharacterized protein n=1 Tax=Helicobacter bilis TaxID=37372 RepID=A0A4U8UA71_9HELI|nr:hypothetical protein [Helicobacter bilis]MCI7410160.1 hypothetical protein [Helicobacter bilis]MDD7297124.1 hypothetical protein [Helicobacter bilis]MDY4401071.1 hypothetical protein [Helicobacter bilis]TLE11531.1 hypothetical protein LS79_002530 [Helicobacter bilis]
MKKFLQLNKTHIKGMQILPLSTDDLIKILESCLSITPLCQSLNKPLAVMKLGVVSGIKPKFKQCLKIYNYSANLAFSP